MFVACAKKDTPAPADPQEPPFTGVKAYFYNAVIQAGEVANNDSIVSVTWEASEIEGLEEGFVSLMDKREDVPYHQGSGGRYDKVGIVELSADEAHDGIRIVVFTTKDSDKATGDTAVIINFDGRVYTQKGVDMDEMTFEQGTYIFVAKVKLG